MRLCRLRKVFLAFGLAVFLSAGTALAAPILSENSHGHDVLKLQRELKRTGYLADEPDGIFGSRTKSAVLAFQRAQSLKETGVVDRETWSRLQKQPAREENAAAPVPASPVPDGAGVKPADAPGKEMRPALEPRIKKAPESAPFLQRAKVAAVIATAKKYIGTPYKFGGTTPKGFDCSGFVQFVFRRHGIAIPRAADEQYRLGVRVKKRQELEPGDLVFFSTYEKGASHCGIYLGDDQFIHVSSRRGVRVDSLDDEYWKPRWYGGKHIVK